MDSAAFALLTSLTMTKEAEKKFTASRDDEKPVALNPAVLKFLMAGVVRFTFFNKRAGRFFLVFGAEGHHLVS
jgi:hypothetical protein